jgi:uncharacterized membrane protein
MSIFDVFGKKDAAQELTKGSPFFLTTELVPYRLYSKRKSSATMLVKVKNATKDVLLTSIVAELPNKLGFDEMMMARQREVRVGEVQPGEEKEVKLGIYSSLGSEEGEYTMSITAMAHYRDYGHVLNYTRKRIKIAVV